MFSTTVKYVMFQSKNVERSLLCDISTSICERTLTLSHTPTRVNNPKIVICPRQVEAINPVQTFYSPQWAIMV